MFQLISIVALWMALGAGMLIKHKVPHPAETQRTIMGVLLGGLLGIWWLLIWPIILARFDK